VPGLILARGNKDNKLSLSSHEATPVNAPLSLLPLFAKLAVTTNAARIKQDSTTAPARAIGLLFFNLLTLTDG
jgi:hypothetical protein